MIKRLVFPVFFFLVIAIAAAFFFRHQIFQYSAEKIIRASLPPYVKIDSIRFDFNGNRVIFRGFRLSNPADFSFTDLLAIREISCRFGLKGKSIMDGIVLTDLVFKEPVLTVERLDNAKSNLTEMRTVFDAGAQEHTVTGAQEHRSTRAQEHKSGNQPDRGSGRPNIIGNKKVSDIIKLPQDFSLQDGKIVFTDRFNMPTPVTTTFEHVTASVTLKLNDTYTGCLGISSTGEGRLNGNTDEVVKWTISYNPTTPRLTMSNRFEVSNVDLVALRPYYDRYSPLYFVRGRFSGNLIFDFDNGDIGSTNEVWLSDFRFYIKKGLENSAFLETTVPDLVKYLSTPYGEIVFDFKIKGDMASPRFYLGPISKQAIAAVAVGKIQDVISSVSETAAQASGQQGSGMEKAQKYIDLLNALIKK